MDTRAPQVDVAAAVSDVRRTLEYRRDVAVTRLLPLGLGLLALGLLMFVLLGPLPALDFNRDNAEGVLAGAVLVLAGIGLSAAALWRRRSHGKPMFVLAPDGIHIRLWPSAFIPWHEVRGIETA